MQEAWEGATRTISMREDYSKNFVDRLILEKMELFGQVYRAAVQEYTKQLSQASWQDLYQPITMGEGQIGHVFATRFMERPAPASQQFYYGSQFMMQVEKLAAIKL